jgi:thioredoxin-related protein
MITVAINNIYHNVICQVWKIRKRQFILIFKNNFILILSIALLTAFISIVSFANEGDSMTEHKTKSNRLINEKSPYLLQHANNPVDWYPWGPEALERARREDKPILLSIGYSTCHWCHVMEEESFTNPQIAELMNENFI